MSLVQMLGTHHVKVQTDKRNQIIDVTRQVQRFVSDTEMVDGIVVAFVPHTTAGITVNENADPDVKSDMLEKLQTLVPQDETYYQHNEGNSDSHVKTAMVGNSATVFVNAGRLTLGRWQGIYFCEFDGPRTRELWLRAMGTRRSD